MQLKQLGSSSCAVDPLGLRKNPRKRKITQPPALGTQWTVVNVKYRGATSLLRQGPASMAMLRGASPDKEKASALTVKGLFKIAASRWFCTGETSQQQCVDVWLSLGRS
jgi:hypothetical protein